MYTVQAVLKIKTWNICSVCVFIYIHTHNFCMYSMSNIWILSFVITLFYLLYHILLFKALRNAEMMHL